MGKRLADLDPQHHSDVGELDDDVGPYGKSLLYLVSNALEGEREVPLLGMQKFLRADTSLSGLPAAHPDGLPGIVVSGEEGPVGAIAKSDTHGGFDDDPNTMNSILHRILGAGPRFPFQDRDLQFQRPARTKKSHRARWP